MTIALALLLVASVPAASEPAASKTVAAPAADPLLEKMHQGVKRHQL